jgi:hypothetical protein
VAVSLRARDLVRELKVAELLVAVRLEPPFAPRGEGWRVHPLTWKPERSLWNAALKTWPRLDRLTTVGPYRWISEPKNESRAIDVQAHLVSAVAKDGTELTFRVPRFDRV